ncbi:MAG: hypothetical protein EKK48_10635 [Candidatus Melainabacteria bacterium]|nr:MAG: hypothetical protein EKK48_10635 [Candidatus Melainabacteria bacterium]
MSEVKGWACWQEPYNAYEIGTDDQIVNVGNRSAFVRSIDGTGQFGAIMQKISADKFRGKRIRFSGFLRCKDAQNGCGLFMEVFALFPENNPLRALDNMSKRLVSGTMEWVKCELTLDVPDDAYGINIGARLLGQGQLWIDGLKFEEVGRDVPLTDEFCRYPSEPQNLDFKDS